MSRKPTVEVRTLPGGRQVCVCHGWSVRYIWRQGLSIEGREPVHCEHPPQHRDYGDGYIPDYCEACGWNTFDQPATDGGLVKGKSPLPPLTPIPGLNIRSVDDFLTPERRRELYEWLRREARNQRLARASAAWIPLP